MGYSFGMLKNLFRRLKSRSHFIEKQTETPNLEVSQTQLDEWAYWLADEDRELIDSLREHGIENVEAYEEFRFNGPPSLVTKIDLKRMAFHQSLISDEDPITLLKLAPLWLRALRVDQFDTTLRLQNAFKCGEIERVGQLLAISSADLLAFPNIGKKSLRDLTDSIISIKDKEPTLEQQAAVQIADIAETKRGEPLSCLDPSAATNDPIALLRTAPDWIQALDVDQFETTMRVKNLLKQNQVEILGDLLKYTRAKLLTWPNMGRTSLRDLTKSLQKLIDKPVSGNIRTDDVTGKEDERIWFNQLLKDLPAIKEELEAHDIYYEKNYLSIRKTLSDKIRDQIDQHRFDFLVSSTSEQNPLALLEICPTWLLDMEIRYFRTSTRIKKFFVSQEIKTLRDLSKFSIPRLARAKNIGRTTLKELYSDIRHAQEKGAPPTYENPITNNLSLRDGFIKTMTSIKNERNGLILQRRLGYDCEAQTLEAISEEFGVTRERIRQVQKKLTDAIIEDEFWDDSLEFKIRRAQQNQSGPLYVEDLQLGDPWFSGFEEDVDLLKNIIASFSHLDINFINHDGKTLLSNIRADEFEQCIRDILEVLDATTNIEFSYEDVEAIIFEKLAELKAEKLADVALERVAQELNFFLKNGNLVLASVGNGRRSRIKAVLEKSPKPLHFSEIARQYAELFGEEVSERSIHATLNVNDFCLFGRGEYGLINHLPSSPENLRNIAQKASAHVETNSTRQWHSEELLKVLRDDHRTLCLEGVDKYVVNICLQKFSELQYLGKMIWVSPSEADISRERIFIKDAIVEALRLIGRPMTVPELDKAVRQHRGIGRTLDELHLATVPRIAKISTGTWGLLYRDFEGSESYWETVLRTLIERLKETNSAIHKSELLSTLRSADLERVPKLNLLQGVLTKDERFRSWHGGFVGLKDWDAPGRKTLLQAVQNILGSGSHEFTIEELMDALTGEVTYSYNRTSLSTLLGKLGVVYDSRSGRWQANSYE